MRGNGSTCSSASAIGSSNQPMTRSTALPHARFTRTPIRASSPADGSMGGFHAMASLTTYYPFTWLIMALYPR
ncbi:hypothetical protein D5S17_33245 [Pseudonocardiaceae bacterium YIM PH 21723]|nr:hypothetical protein D5S17_33245 [Pseudonocardiaceae bacterium YIM PH 21723]